jgi:transcriptional regulator with XRE-family HTH domain
MKSDFPRILTLLRKEKGVSQKCAAGELEVSQALLSHYEKGIRECGLEFVIRAANYYGVSCDYLLGRSPDRTGAVLSIEDIPEPDAAGKENVLHGRESLLPTLNKKLIANSMNILYDMLQKSGSRELTTEVSDYLMTAVYKMFREVYSANTKNPEGLFAVDAPLYDALSAAAMEIGKMKVHCIVKGEVCEDIAPIENCEALAITPEKIAQQYPLFATSLSNLIKTVETKMGAHK